MSLTAHPSEASQPGGCQSLDWQNQTATIYGSSNSSVIFTVFIPVLYEIIVKIKCTRPLHFIVIISYKYMNLTKIPKCYLSLGMAYY